MTPPEITFGPIGLGDREQARIRGALRRIPASGPGSWPVPVDHVEVVRLLTGGLSGAVTAQVVVHRGNQEVVHVVKVDLAANLRGEWQAFTQHVKPVANSLCAPIIAATPEVVSAGGGPAPTGFSAIVYDHVGQYAGEPSSELCTLEDIARTALALGHRELDNAVELIRVLLTGIAPVLHDRHKVVPTPMSLRAANLELGVNLTLRVEQAGPERISVALRPDDEVLVRTLRGHQDFDLRPGELLAMSGLRRRNADDPTVLLGDAVAIRLDSSSSFAPADDPDLTVFGTVVATRGAVHRARLADVLAGHPHADPFDALPSVLTQAVRGRVRSVGHGDLNPRNIVVAGSRPYLIDYAHTSADRPQQEDFCWLELGLLRGVVGELGTAVLLDLLRVLALGTFGLDSGADAHDVEATCLQVLPDALHNPFRLLWAVRVQAHRRHPHGPGEPWALAYLRHLLLSAHRTLKWDLSQQTTVQLAASAAAAAVATEWLTAANPFQHWPQPMVATAMRGAAVLLPHESDQAVRRYGQLVAIAEEQRVPELEAMVADYRTGLVLRRCAEPAVRLIAERTAAHLEYVDLEVVLAQLSEEDSAVLAGDHGIGKSATAGELVYRLATQVRDGKAGCRMPLALTTVPEDIVSAARTAGFGAAAECALALGALTVVLDDFTQQSGLAWLTYLRTAYPRLRFVLCTRGIEVDIPDFTTIRLRGVNIEGIRAFLHNKLTARGHHSFAIDQLVTSLVDDPAWQRAGLHRPGVLSVLVKHITSTGQLTNLPNPHELAFHGLPSDEQARDYCTRLAAHLLGDGPTPLDPDSSADQLIVTGVLTVNGDRLEFREEVHRDYFAAMALRAAPDRVAERLSCKRWHNAGLIFVTLPGISTDTVRRVVTNLTPVAVVFAAQLLNSAGLSHQGFIAQMLSTLQSEHSGPTAWFDASEALGVLGSRASMSALGAIARDLECTDLARIAALDSLYQAQRSARCRALQRTGARIMAAAVLAMLTSDNSDRIRGEALDILAAAQLTGLELVITRLVDPGGPWPLTRKAFATLRRLGTVVPAELADTYVRAAHAAVEALECQLRTTASTIDAQALHHEIESIVETLPWTASRDWLLRRRFAFDLHVVTAGLVDVLIEGHQVAGTQDPGELVKLLDHADPVIVNEAAHRLLRAYPDRTDEVLRQTDANSSTARLLVAAAAARQLGRPEEAERLFLALLPTVEGDRLEPLAALLCAIFDADRRKGIVLAATAAANLADRAVAERVTWPWNIALARCCGTTAELDLLLSDNPDLVGLAIEALAGRTFFRAGRPGPAHVFSERSRHILLAQRPFTTIDQVQWIRAVATAGVAEALPRVLQLIPGLAEQTVHRGGVDQPAVTDALAVAGYLGRRAADAGSMPEDVARARLLLMRSWPGAEHTRAVGLRYLDAESLP